MMTVREHLRLSLQQGRLVHAYLLAGGSEDDRLELAKYLAAALVCRQSKQGEPCGSCRCCQQLANDSYPDFYLLKPQGASLKINQIRGLQKKLPLRSFRGGARVAVLAGADTLTAAAANCLLKTLEEPSEGLYIILLAAQPDLLLPTVRSRCQELHLSAGEENQLIGADYWYQLAAAAHIGIMLQEILPRLEKEKELAAVLGAMALACRDQLTWQLTGKADLLMLAKHPAMSKELTLLQLWHCYQIIEGTRVAVERSANRRLALEVLIFKLHHQLCRGGEENDYCSGSQI